MNTVESPKSSGEGPAPELPAFHPACRVFELEKLSNRGKRLLLAGKMGESFDLMSALARALAYPGRPVVGCINIQISAPGGTV